MSYDNTNRGAAWGNDKKEKDTHPDFKGSINVEGKEFWFSMWKRKPDAKPKAPAVSFQIVAKEDVHREGQASVQSAMNQAPTGTPRDMPGQAPQQRPVQQEQGMDSFDDDIPFS